jgi:hypothetical protein
MMARPPVHASVTGARLTDATERQMTSLDNPGFCLACGAEQDGCEPDARRCECESCGARQVYGAEELLLMGAYHEDAD